MITFPLQFILVLIATFLISLILTPFVRLLAFKIDAVDYPNARRINKKPMPSAGGLAIILAFTIATVILLPMITKGHVAKTSYLTYTVPVVVGGWIIGLTGLVDDIWTTESHGTRRNSD